MPDGHIIANTDDISSTDYREAALLSARNARIGIQTHPIAALGVLVAASFDRAPMSIAATACVLSLIAALLRWFGSRRLCQLVTLRPADWLWMVAVPALLANAIWGAMTAALLWQIGMNNITLLILLGSIAIVFGCTASFAAFQWLSLALVGVHLAPPLLVALLQGDADWALMALLLIAFLAYIVRQAISQHRDYWQALHTRNRLTEAHQQAEQANRAKDQFLANISHEIRTPLNGIAAPTELLQHTALNHEQRHYTTLIAASTRTLMQLIDDLLDFSKMQAGKLGLHGQPFSPLSLIEEVVARHRIPCERKGLDLRLSHNNLSDCWFEGDALRIGQILDNLLSNAVKFTEHGSITIEAEFNDARLQVRVSDTGDGIDENLRERIFQPFVQADLGTTRRHGGTGLGLSICKQLVEQMNGELNYTSTPGAGSCFYLALPLPRCNAPEIFASTTAPRTFPNLRVLVAEDNVINQQVIQRQLALLQIDARIVNDGRAALAAAQSEPFDLIILDCQMPELDGYQTAAHLRTLGGAFAEIPIIALSAHAMANDATRALDAGMDDYLAKPASLQLLADTIGKWVDRAAE